MQASALPSSRGGVDAASIKSREATLTAADGVVRNGNLFVTDHPVCAFKERGHLYYRRSHPSSRGGECRSLPKEFLNF